MHSHAERGNDQQVSKQEVRKITLHRLTVARG